MNGLWTHSLPLYSFNWILKFWLAVIFRRSICVTIVKNLKNWTLIHLLQVNSHFILGSIIISCCVLLAVCIDIISNEKCCIRLILQFSVPLLFLSFEKATRASAFFLYEIVIDSLHFIVIPLFSPTRRLVWMEEINVYTCVLFCSAAILSASFTACASCSH